jgi:hypothetical protein
MWSDDAADLFGADELSDDDLEQAYAEAVCRDADLTGFSAHGERINGTLALLAAITAHTPALRLLITVVDEDGDGRPQRLVRLGRAK